MCAVHLCQRQQTPLKGGYKLEDLVEYILGDVTTFTPEVIIRIIVIIIALEFISALSSALLRK